MIYFCCYIAQSLVHVCHPEFTHPQNFTQCFEVELGRIAHILWIIVKRLKIEVFDFSFVSPVTGHRGFQGPEDHVPYPILGEKVKKFEKLPSWGIS